jgi:CheY-like chemotaxis protein
VNILIVEDDASVAIAISRLLKAMGHGIVVAAANGHAALDLLPGAAFDAILLDIHLPDTNGLRLIPELRRIRPTVEIVTMSALSTPEMEADLRSLGVTHHLPKPFDAAHLDITLAYLVYRRALNAR